MFSVAVGIVATILISVSRVAELWVPLERALVAPAVACSVGAALVNLWASVRAEPGAGPAGLLLFVVGLFQAEWALAMLRPRLREVATPAGVAIHGAALGIALLWIVGGGAAEGLTGTDVVAIALSTAVLVMLGFLLRARRTTAAGHVRRVAARTAVELRSLVVAMVSLLTFLAVAGPGHGHA